MASTSTTATPGPATQAPPSVPLWAAAAGAVVVGGLAFAAGMALHSATSKAAAPAGGLGDASAPTAQRTGSASSTAGSKELAAAVAGAGDASARSSSPADPEDKRNVVVRNQYFRHRRTSLEGSSCIVVGVGGASGSGKTSIANLIKKRMGPTCIVVSMSADSYYITLPKGADATKWNFDVPDAIDHQLLAQHLAMMKNGEPVDVPMYDFSTHKRLKETKRIERAHVVIVDGIFTLHVDAVRSQCDVTMFTMEDLDVCLARRLRRDIVERKRDVESVLHQYQTFVKPGFETFVAPSMRHADFIIPRARDNKIAIDMLARDIVAQAQAEVRDFPTDDQFTAPPTVSPVARAGEGLPGFVPPAAATVAV